MPRSAAGWAVTIGAPVLVVVLVVLLAGGGGSGSGETGVQARAAAICSDAERSLGQLSDSPTSVAEGLEIEHSGLAIFQRQLAQLEALAPSAGDSFRAALKDDREFLDGLSSMIARPDFVKLSLTLPGHPDRVPSWMKKWHAREQALLADARDELSRAGIPACEKSLG